MKSVPAPVASRGRLRAFLLALSVILALGTFGTSARAEITMPEILMKTITALPSCLKYQVKGVCFFLKCGWGCSIRTSIRVSHYVPDAIVSTYHEPLTHPWVEVGKPISTAMSAVGGAMLGGGVLDSAGSTVKENESAVTFKSVDAIGNPVGMIAQVAASGQLPDLPSAFGVPGLTELQKFPSQELPSIKSRWAAVPSSLMNSLTEGAAKLAKLPTEITTKIAALPEYLGKLQSAIGNVGQVMQGGLEITKFADTTAKIAGIDLGPLKSVVALAEFASEGAPLGSLFCPGAASAFTLHFQSDLDALFWRDMVPVETLYPESWIPTLSEVSTSPAISTWGGRYPRTGSLVQDNPVKASAVYAERVAEIIKKTAQPHIYKPLVASGNFRYFTKFADTRWQMLNPSDTGCITFGENDSLGVTSFGDYKTSSTAGYVWNMWNRYDCCEKRGAYLFSIP